MGETVEVIVSDVDDGMGDAGEATALAEGMVLGAAVAASADAQETADVAEATAEMAATAVVAESDRLDRLEALLVALHDEMLANDATLAEHLAVLLDAEEATMEAAEGAEIEAATAEAEVTEIVEEHAEYQEEKAADEQSSESAESGPEAQSEAEQPGESGRHERAGSIRFRRGRRR